MSHSFQPLSLRSQKASFVDWRSRKRSGVSKVYAILSKRRGLAYHILNIAWKGYFPILAAGQSLGTLIYPISLFNKRDYRLALDCTASVLFLAASWIAFIALIPLNPYLVLVWIFSFFLVYEMLSAPNHYAIGYKKKSRKDLIYNQYKYTRSCEMSEKAAYWIFLNFNFHTEHHLYPTLPWPELKKANQHLKDTLKESYNCEHWIKWNRKQRKLDVSTCLSQDAA